MSASRALASARNRKAGQNTQSPSVPYQESNNGSMVPPGVIPVATPTKISIPQAIQLLGNRIDILETTLKSKSDGGNDDNNIIEQMEGKFAVDADVFQDIVNRLESLETKIAVITHNQTQSVENSLDGDIKNKLDMALANNENISTVLEDMNTMKNTILSLQSFVMETHAKLSEYVFSLPNETNADYSQIFKPATSSTNVNESSEVSKVGFEFPSEIPTGSLDRPILERQTNISAEDVDKIIKSSSEPHLSSKHLGQTSVTLKQESITEDVQENVTLETSESEEKEESTNKEQVSEEM